MNKRKAEKADNKEFQDKEFQDKEPGAEAEPSAEAADEVEQLRADLSGARAEAAEAYDRLLRLSAEFDNYKKRMQRQTEDRRKYANENLIKDLLSVVDNLERALNASREPQNQNDTCMMEGLEMTLNEIRKVLKKYHVEPVEAKGRPFDPAIHEAVMQQPSDQYPDNTVIEEMQKGYLLHDRLIRPAMVVVSKATA